MIYLFKRKIICRDESACLRTVRFPRHPLVFLGAIWKGVSHPDSKTRISTWLGLIVNKVVWISTLRPYDSWSLFLTVSISDSVLYLVPSQTVKRDKPTRTYLESYFVMCISTFPNHPLPIVCPCILHYKHLMNSSYCLQIRKKDLWWPSFVSRTTQCSVVKLTGFTKHYSSTLVSPRLCPRILAVTVCW